MNSSTSRLALSVVVAAAGLLALAGCTPGPGAVENYSGLPDEHDVAGASEEVDGGPQAFWMNDGGQIAITVWGSSTCPPIGKDLNVVEPAGEGNSVDVVMAPISDGPCTMDYVPHTTVFSTPLHVTTAKPLQISVGDTTIELPIK
ncbi:MAG: hypothetical protein ABWX82_07935 [Leifsonia sp.]